MTIHYQVHLLGGATVGIDAATINLGFKKLWFYDHQDNLLAVFRWHNIIGFTVRDSAEGQAITEDLLHEKKQIEQLEQRKGPVLAAVERVHQVMQQTASEVSTAVFEIYDGTKNQGETDVLRSRHGYDIRRGLQQLLMTRAPCKISCGGLSRSWGPC